MVDDALDPIVARTSATMILTSYDCLISTMGFPLLKKLDPYIQGPGPHLNIKTVFSRYGDSHVKDKTVGETVLSLTWESLYWLDDIFILRRPPGGNYGFHGCTSITYLTAVRLMRLTDANGSPIIHSCHTITVHHVLLDRYRSVLGLDPI